MDNSYVKNNYKTKIENELLFYICIDLIFLIMCFVLYAIALLQEAILFSKIRSKRKNK